MTLRPVLILLLPLAACGPATLPTGINDPYEASNRQAHQLNTELDQTLLKPLSGAYGGGMPPQVRRSVTNFADNLGTPASVVNNLLQLRVDSAVHNTIRFVVNTTVGIGGLFDPATAIGLEERDTDFGETLHVWGVPEGPYVEIPVIGPSTQRDAAGAVVDLFTNPLSYVLPSPEKYATTAAKALSNVGDRYTYGSTVDSILYESADSYAQARILYLENRRFELRRGRLGALADDEYFDPYADEAGVAATDTDDDFVDPYEDLE